MKGTYHFRPCPHCGELMRAGTLIRHEKVCVKRPDIYARLRGVLIADDGHGITYKRYLELSSTDKTLPSLNTLIRRTHTTQWAGVLAFFKLSSPPAAVHAGNGTEAAQAEAATPARRAARGCLRSRAARSARGKPAAAAHRSNREQVGGHEGLRSDMESPDR